MAPSMGVFAKLGMCDSGDLAVDEGYEFISEQLAMKTQLIEPNGIRGTRSHVKERVRAGLQQIGGPVVLQPSAAELAILLPRILGAVASGTTFALAETVPQFTIGIDRVAKVFTYSGCAVDQATFRSQSGQALELQMAIEAESESIGNAGTFPAISIGTDPPFVFSDAVLVIGGTTYEFGSFECSINNMLKKDRFMNSTTRSDLPAMDRKVGLRLGLPYTSDTTSLYTTAVTGAAATVTFTNGALSMLFTFANLITPPNGAPAIGNSRDEIMLNLEGDSRMSGSTRELVITLDSTP